GALPYRGARAARDRRRPPGGLSPGGRARRCGASAAGAGRHAFHRTPAAKERCMTSPSPATTIFRARAILTTTPAQPEATHVAVRDGRILGVGDAESLQGWGAATVDERYADQVLMPGLVEGHCHL